MAKNWLSVTVELLGGRGHDLWPWPGRIFAVGPSHTFLDLANSINDAFARWDRSHLSVFTLADGRVVTDEETGDEMSSSGFGPILTPIDIATVKVAATLTPGAEFRYTFDLGDNWTHRCVVANEKVDPMNVLGIRPSAPLPHWGWGSIPDQYGRRWENDDGESPAPRRPTRPHPMMFHDWPTQDQTPALDVSELRRAIAARDASRFLSAITGCDIDDNLQQVGAGIPMALEQKPQDLESVALSIINRLTWRGAAGDQVLADELLSALRDEPLPGRALPVDLEMLSMLLEGDPDQSTGCYVDLHTGITYGDPESEWTADGDSTIDISAEPDRWLWLDHLGSRPGWHDMAAFAQKQRDATLRARLEQAIEGKGAFRRFHDAIHDENLSLQWNEFSTDRQLGRAREALAAEGIRVS